MISVSAEMISKTYVAGEVIQVRITLENPGGAPVAVPDPLFNEVYPKYTITAPDGQEHTVSLESAHAADSIAPPNEEMIELAPGEKRVETIPLNKMFPFADPGSYGLQVAFRSNGERVLAQGTSFHIEAAQVTAFAATPTAQDSPDARLFMAWAHAGDSGQAVVEEVRLGRSWGDDRAGKLYTVRVDSEAVPRITQVSVPATHVERGMDFANWLVWTDGSSISVQRTDSGNLSGAAATVYSSRGTLVLVDSPAMDAAHNLKIFAVESSPSRIVLLRIDVNREDPTANRIAYQAGLMFSPIDSRALHFQVDGDDRSVILCLGTTQEGTVLVIVHDGTPPSVQVAARLGAEPPVPGYPLSAYRTSDDQIAAACATLPVDSRGVVHVHRVFLNDGTQERARIPVDEMRFGDEVMVRWGDLTYTQNGIHFLYRDSHDQLWCLSDGTPLSRISTLYSFDPPPRVIVNGDQAFIIGNRVEDGFGIQGPSGPVQGSIGVR